MSAQPRHPELRQEEDRVSRWRVVLGMVVVVVISAVIVAWAWGATNNHEASLRPRMTFPEERLGPRRPIEGINQYIFEEQRGVGEILKDRQQRSLETYRWLDQSRRIVTLPIDRAMDRIAEENAQ